MDELPYVPPWFFLTSNIRVLWIDLIENWIYLEVELSCPRCGYVDKQYYLLSSKERSILLNIKCKSCGYAVGEILYRELEWSLAEIESLVKRCTTEK